MALEPRDLGASTTPFPSSKRFFAIRRDTVKLAAIAGAPVLEVGFPLQESAVAGTYEPWAVASGKPISAFVEPKAHQSSATGETLAAAMVEGKLHRDDVVLPAGEAQVDLDAALRAVETRLRGFQVQGLPDLSL